MSGAEVITLDLPGEERYVDVALAALEALARRAGVDADEVVLLHRRLAESFADRFTGGRGDTVRLRYEVGEGFLGVRVEDQGR